MKNQTFLLLEKLEAIYQGAVKSPTPKLFFLSLLEYIELYDTNPILEPIWKRIVALGEKDLKELKNLEQKSYEEMRQVYQKIKEFVDKNHITLAGVLLKRSMKKNEKSSEINKENLRKK